MESRPTVYVVDDDSVTRESLAELCDAMQTPYRLLSTSAALLETVDAQTRGCVILELRLRGISGLELQQKLQEADVTLPLIFLTAYADVRSAVQAMKQGAFDFVAKPANENQLWDTIQRALTHDERTHLERSAHREVSKRMARLSAGEHEVLWRLIEGQTNRQIAQSLNLSLRTIEMRRSSLMKKLDARSAVELARLALTANGQIRPDPMLPLMFDDNQGEQDQT